MDLTRPSVCPASLPSRRSGGGGVIGFSLDGVGVWLNFYRRSNGQIPTDLHVQDILDKLMHFFLQLSDFVSLKKLDGV